MSPISSILSNLSVVFITQMGNPGRKKICTSLSNTNWTNLGKFVAILGNVGQYAAPIEARQEQHEPMQRQFSSYHITQNTTGLEGTYTLFSEEASV